VVGGEGLLRKPNQPRKPGNPDLGETSLEETKMQGKVDDKLENWSRMREPHM
jgi:hypothetical protein